MTSAAAVGQHSLQQLRKVSSFCFCCSRMATSTYSVPHLPRQGPGTHKPARPGHLNEALRQCSTQRRKSTKAMAAKIDKLRRQQNDSLRREAYSRKFTTDKVLLSSCFQRCKFNTDPESLLWYTLYEQTCTCRNSVMSPVKDQSLMRLMSRAKTLSHGLNSRILGNLRHFDQH